MTLAVALTRHTDRMLLGPGPHRVVPSLHDQQNLRVPTTEARIKGSSAAAILFGNFCLMPTQRLLSKAGEPVRLGSRALDILIALVERHGELVTKRELMSIVWPGITVVEANLAVHISALRRALRDGQAGIRYLVNIPGQGYRFIAPISMTEGLPPASWVPAMAEDLDTRTMLMRLLGSADEVRRLAKQLLQVSDSGA